MEERRFYPPWLLILRMLGTATLLGAVVTLARKSVGPPWLGFVLIGAFFVLRLTAEWTLALRYPDPEGRHKRSAILNTFITIAVTAFWFYLQKRGIKLG
jgi:hypothetical protein